MKKALRSFFELIILILFSVLLFAFIGLPSTTDPLLQRQSLPTIQAGDAGLESWDQSLVLPSQSDRIASYTMDVKLDTATNIISGWEVLEWRNTTGGGRWTFPFHLYHNAWKNNRSTYAKEARWSLGRSGMNDEDYGFTNVKKVIFLDPRRGEIDITDTFTYIDPENENPDDQTVFQISTPRAIRRGETARFRIEFETKQPLALRRTGVMRTYHFVAQWFPKIGVWWNGTWNCYPYHNRTEYFADFGVYDVTLTLPKGYVVGATGGIPRWQRNNEDGTVTYNFYQEDVHDFTWVTSPDLVRTERTFTHDRIDASCSPSRHHTLREVKVILLSQPHHENLIERYFDATFKALRFYGEWYGEYPYETVTVVDPANGSRSGGMEYPTIFTGGGNMFSPPERSSPEGVTVHEFGHQFWYGLVASNEFEEPWLDEGFNTYSTSRTMMYGWDPFKVDRTYFGGPGAQSYAGIPFVFHELDSPPRVAGNLEIRQVGKNDIMTRRSWEYYKSYGTNAYTKPAMSLWMLENYLGEPMMYRVMRTYHHRYRFAHPTTQDFMRTVNEVSGQDMNWFFEQTWFSSNLFDYTIDEIVTRPIPPPTGIFTENGKQTNPPEDLSAGMVYSEVIVKREGEATAPVDVLIVFEDGEEVKEEWDGKGRWQKFTYERKSPVRYAVVDPDQKIVLDIDYSNNSKVVRDPGFQSVAARKIAARWMFWVQVGFEFSSFWH